MAASETAARRKSRASMLLIIALFATPVVLAWLLFFVFPNWTPESTNNHGELIQPARPLPPFKLQGLNGEALDESFLLRKWTFVYLYQGSCREACIQQLYKIRQVRLTQGKHIDRLQRLMLWQADGVDEAARQELQAHFPGQVIAIVSKADRPLLAEFDALQDDGSIQVGLYLVDPIGNLMMAYSLDQAPRGIIKDLQRLLKYSSLR